MTQTKNPAQTKVKEAAPTPEATVAPFNADIDDRVQSDYPQAPEQIVQRSHAAVSVTASAAPEAAGEQLWASVTRGANTEVIDSLADDQKTVPANSETVFERVDRAENERLLDTQDQRLAETVPGGDAS